MPARTTVILATFCSATKNTDDKCRRNELTVSSGKAGFFKAETACQLRFKKNQKINEGLQPDSSLKRVTEDEATSYGKEHANALRDLGKSNNAFATKFEPYAKPSKIPSSK